MKKRLKRKNFFSCDVRLNAGNCVSTCVANCPVTPTHLTGASGYLNAYYTIT